MSLMKLDITEPLPPSVPPFLFHFIFIKTSSLIIFPSFSMKLIHFCLVKSQKKPDTLDDAFTINPDGHRKNQ